MRLGRRCLLAAVGVLVTAAPLAGAPAGAAPTPPPATPDPTSAGASTAAVSAATYSWGCSYPDHAPRPATAPLGPTPKAGRPTIGGEKLAGAGVVVPAGAPPLPTNIAATSWIVADLDSGAVYGALGAHRRQVPASIFKVLMSATVLPKLDPATKVEFACEDNYGWGSEWDSDPVDLSLALGGVYTVEDLFHAALMKSSNDAANALARTAGGTRGTAGTIDDMNALAHRIGAWDTHAATPSGLDPYQLPEGLDDNYQVTSAYDMALILREALRYDNFRQYILTKDYVLPAQPELGVGPHPITARNSNWPTSPGFIYTYPDAIGGKTGYTSLAGNTFVGAREHDGHRIVAVVLGVPSQQPADNRAYQQAGSLIDWAFSLPQAIDPVGHLAQPGEAEGLYSAKAPAPPRPVVVVPPTAGGGLPWMWIVAGAMGAVVLLGGGLLRRRRRVGTALATASATPVDSPPQSVEPLQAAPKDGEPAVPQSAEPERAGPMDAEPAPAAPQSAEPTPAAPKAAEPAPAAPQSADPAAPPDTASAGSPDPGLPPPANGVARGVAKVPTTPPGPYPGQPSPFMGQPPA